MESGEVLARLGLNAVAGLGPARIRRLLHAHGSARTAVATLPDGRAILARGREELAAAEDLGATVLCPGSPGWPPALEDLAFPPPVLLALGDTAVLGAERHRVAVVGARACTPYGRSQARRMGLGLAGAGVVVVSGAARGVDRAAMEGALEAGGRVVAVLGSGLGRPYPPEARPLLERVLAGGGAVVSEFPVATRPHRGNFPRRNRILAALSRAVVVVQATACSGSMITAGAGTELGREVFAIPGPVDSVVSQGVHRLLREGANLAEGPEDVLAFLTLLAPPAALPPAQESPLLAALERGDRTAGELAAELGREAGEVLELLAELELEGRVRRLPGGYYHRLRP